MALCWGTRAVSFHTRCLFLPVFAWVGACEEMLCSSRLTRAAGRYGFMRGGARRVGILYSGFLSFLGGKEGERRSRPSHFLCLSGLGHPPIHPPLESKLPRDFARSTLFGWFAGAPDGHVGAPAVRDAAGLNGHVE